MFSAISRNKIIHIVPLASLDELHTQNRTG